MVNGTTMQLPAPEPDFGPWNLLPDKQVADLLANLATPLRPLLVLVDGRSAGGKTTFAERIAGYLRASVVHTDDIAWHHDFFDWEDLLFDGVLDPWLAGRAVSYRPPAWQQRDREGAVRARAGRPLVIEGVGSARPAMARLADAVVWCQSDVHEAERRGIERDMRYGRTAAEARAFWDEWGAREVAVQADSRPWQRAHLVVNSTPDAAGLAAAGSQGATWCALGPAVRQ